MNRSRSLTGFFFVNKRSCKQFKSCETVSLAAHPSHMDTPDKFSGMFSPSPFKNMLQCKDTSELFTECTRGVTREFTGWIEHFTMTIATAMAIARTQNNEDGNCLQPLAATIYISRLFSKSGGIRMGKLVQMRAQCKQSRTGAVRRASCSVYFELHTEN